MKEIRNCTFRFKCPRSWDDLQITKIASQRHCPACSRNVHLCRTPSELSAAIRKDLCVAVDIKDKSTGKINRLLGDAII